MTSDLKEIENSALNLNKNDKARLVDKLLQSIHGKIEPEIEQAWFDEIQARKESLKAGNATLHLSKDVLSEARKHIKK